MTYDSLKGLWVGRSGPKARGKGEEKCCGREVPCELEGIGILKHGGEGPWQAGSTGGGNVDAVEVKKGRRQTPAGAQPVGRHASLRERVTADEA